ncbi:MAG: hypothetical protein IT445_03480 [Phycisphaeraceae bacterium]|nr:hypothetical protein [Phycisphaeraceae bacterium]
MSNMLRMLELLLVVLSAPVTLGSEPALMLLDGDWDFTYTPAIDLEAAQLPVSAAYQVKITIPGRWDDQLDRFLEAAWWPQAEFVATVGPLQYLSGVGWHRRTVDVPADWSGRAVKLTIGWTVGTAYVWINGELIGTYMYGVYTPFSYDVSSSLHYGQSNELVIAVCNNDPQNFAGGWALFGLAGNASGITRSVTLEASAGRGRIDDCFVEPGVDLKEIVWHARLQVPVDDQQMPATRMHWQVRDQDNRQVLQQGSVDVPAVAGSAEITWRAREQRIEPWSCNEPNLYWTHLRWESAQGELIDATQMRFGLRRFHHEGRKLFLNGRPIYLRGEMGVYYFPIDVMIPTSREFWLNHIRVAKEYGFNFINFAAKVCPPEMMEAADELGMLLQCGDETTAGSNEGRLTAEKRRPTANYVEVWEPILRLGRRHPSMSIYGFGGEHRYYEGVIEQYQKQYDLIRSMHRESLVMPQQAIKGIDYNFSTDDPPTQEVPFPHHVQRLAQYNKACDLFGHYSSGAFSYTYFDMPWHEMEERFVIYEKPLVAHELFLGASYLDPTTSKLYTGRVPPFFFERLEKDLRANDLLERWEQYFDYSSRFQHINRKYCFEKVRKCDGLAGYEALEMTDAHFTLPEYAVGFLDEFYRLKPGETVEGIRRYINDSVLLIDYDGGDSINRAYWEDQAFSADIMVSYYQQRPMRTGKLRWALTQDGRVVMEDEVEVSDIPDGGVKAIGKISFDWPQVDQTTRYNLAVSLVGDGYELNNDWDFWVFDHSDPPVAHAAVDEKSMPVLEARYPGLEPLEASSQTKLWVVSELDEQALRHLEAGGDVLLLGARPFTEYKLWPRYMPPLGSRPFPNGVAILADHPVFKRHPNEGWSDWPFFPLMHGANCVLFDGAIPVPFDPIMEIISCAGHVRKQALIFENRVGAGRLLVASTVFDMENASCAALMDSILSYVQSDQFQPQNSITPADIERALNGHADNAIDDAGFEQSGYWRFEGNGYEIDHDTYHSGRASMKLNVTLQQLASSTGFTAGKKHTMEAAMVSPQQSVAAGFAAGASPRYLTRYVNVELPSQPRHVRLSAWYKVAGFSETDDLEGVIDLSLNYKDANGEAQNVKLSPMLRATGDDWQYVEEVFDTTGAAVNAQLILMLRNRAGTVWLDDIYLGPGDAATDDQAGAAAVSSAAGDVQWHNQPVTSTFDGPVSFRIDDGPWQQGSSATISKEGVHTLLIKASGSDGEPGTQTIGIDTTPPRITLQTDQFMDQVASIFQLTSGATVSLDVSDELSGVAEVMVASKDGQFKPYTGPFKLEPGDYRLQCRARDHAGNVGTVMTGPSLNMVMPDGADILDIHVTAERQ